MERTKQYAISIIIPICNSPDYFRHILSTVINQTKNSVEIIVVDESDKDNLESNRQHIILFNEPRIKHITRKDQKGTEYATEIGIKSATGELKMLVYSKEQWKANQEEKNGLFGKFVTKIIGEKE